MPEPSSPLHPSSPEKAAWDDAEWLEVEVPVVAAVESQPPPRVILPEPRNFSEPASAAKPEGIHIDSRTAIRLIEGAESSGSRKIQITEHGKGVIRLEGEVATIAVAKQNQLPVMKPRGSKATSKNGSVSADWGQAASQSNRWLWWAGSGVVVLLLGGLALQPLLVDKDQDRTASNYGTLQVADDVIGVADPMVYFSENPAQVITEIQHAVETYAKAKTVEDALPVIRNGAKLKGQLEKLWVSWNVPDNWTVSNDDAISYASVGKLPYAIISGTRPDFSPYRLFLVREHDQMLVDWEASLGLGTRTFGEMKDLSTKSGELRVVMSPIEFYTRSFPESRYRAYRLGSVNGQEFLWGYVERGSPAAAALGEIFNETAMFSDKPREQEMRLRLQRAASDAAPNQWLVLDVLHKGWVTP